VSAFWRDDTTLLQLTDTSGRPVFELSFRHAGYKHPRRCAIALLRAAVVLSHLTGPHRAGLDCALAQPHRLRAGLQRPGAVRGHRV